MVAAVGRRQWIWAGGAAAALSVGLWILLASTDPVGEPSEPASLPTDDRVGSESADKVESGGKPSEGGEAGDAEPSAEELRRRREMLAERRATRAYRAYVEAIGERDGERVCELIEPGFLDQLKPPVRRGACAERISGSIGYADPRGFPVWAGTEFSGVESVRISGPRVQLSAAIITRFADREQPSIESDVAYLLPGPAGYRLAKASGALWRAVGKPDVPPQVVSPPPGF